MVKLQFRRQSHDYGIEVPTDLRDAPSVAVNLSALSSSRLISPSSSNFSAPISPSIAVNLRRGRREHDGGRERNSTAVAEEDDGDAIKKNSFVDGITTSPSAPIASIEAVDSSIPLPRRIASIEPVVSTESVDSSNPPSHKSATSSNPPSAAASASVSLKHPRREMHLAQISTCDSSMGYSSRSSWLFEAVVLVSTLCAFFLFCCCHF
ncbi:ATP binding [Striga asiatica]|uniref:ATP binding n=1 Tax=Striga asiatica TaxID=4170 RepID=A0A5A7R0P1_STRAF|nr:ATP binding [Striga asiatica]